MPKRSKTSNMSLTFYGPEIESVVREATEPGLWALGQVVKRAAESRAPRRSGTLQASSFVATVKRTDYVRHRGDRHKKTMTRILQKVSAQTALVGFGAWYSNLYEDTGAKRHAIPYVGKTGRARKRKTLQITGIGFRKGVSHPGVKPQPFLGPALEATKASGTEAFAREVREELERAL